LAWRSMSARNWTARASGVRQCREMIRLPAIRADDFSSGSRPCSSPCRMPKLSAPPVPRGVMIPAVRGQPTWTTPTAARLRHRYEPKRRVSSLPAPSVRLPPVLSMDRRQRRQRPCRGPRRDRTGRSRRRYRDRSPRIPARSLRESRPQDQVATWRRDPSRGRRHPRPRPPSGPFVELDGVDHDGLVFNITGGAWDPSPELYAKNFELLRTVIPKLSRVAVIWNPNFKAAGPYLKATEDAARQFGVALQTHQVRERSEFESAFASIGKERAEAVVVFADPLAFLHRRLISELAAQYPPSLRSESLRMRADFCLMAPT
jgi:hypothetical protein